MPHKTIYVLENNLSQSDLYIHLLSVTVVLWVIWLLLTYFTYWDKYEKLIPLFVLGLALYAIVLLHHFDYLWGDLSYT